VIVWSTKVQLCRRVRQGRHERRKRSVAALAIPVLFFAGSALSAQPSPMTRPATEICASGARSALGHPSNACWEAFEEAKSKRDYAAAFEVVQVGCERYKRTDFCLFRANWDLTPESIRAGVTSVDKYKLRLATERAELVVQPRHFSSGCWRV
jgi:hypothetical protein